MKRACCFLLLLSACADPTCDAEAIAGALRDASPGDVVSVGQCTVVADLEVPVGVTLRGAGPSSIVEAATSTAVRLRTGPSGVTRLEALTVRSGACAGVVIDGAGEAWVEGARLDVTRGIGLGADGVSQVTLSDVDVVGPIADGSPPSAIPAAPYSCASSETATHGIVLARTNAELTRVTSRGFVGFGALFVDSTVTWSAGASSDHIGAGLEVYGGSATLTDLELCGARQDSAPIESFNGLFVAGAVVSSVGLRVCDGQVFGLFHDRASATHTSLEAIDNGFAGVWSQNAPLLDLRDATLARNAFAGVATFEVAELTIADSTVTATAEGIITMGPGGGRVPGADGVHIVATPSATLARVTLSDNARVGLLQDLAGRTSADLSVTDVRVDGAGMSLGAILQNGTVTPGWDTNLVRDGATDANDLAFDGTLPIAGAVGPSCLPATDGVVSGGLSSLVP